MTGAVPGNWRTSTVGAMRPRMVLLGVVFLATLAVAVCSGWRIMAAIDRPSYTQTYSIRVAGLDRSYEVIAPAGPLRASAPVIVVLHGIAATVPQEVRRDRLVPYVNLGKAELVYPVAYRESWNAIGCCGKAATHHVNDVAFLKALVAKVDPGHRHPVYLVGFSNGGRLAYRMACGSPGLFDAMAIVKAMPEPDCVLGKPLTILQVDSLDDPFVPYRPGGKGPESPPATVQAALLRALDRCSGPGTSEQHGELTLTTWDACATGTRYAFAVYQAGGHNFPQPSGPTPGAGQVIWSFFSGTVLAPVPSLPMAGPRPVSSPPGASRPTRVSRSACRAAPRTPRPS